MIISPIVSGVRQEEDLYVRLIDSVTKAVSASHIMLENKKKFINTYLKIWVLDEKNTWAL